GALLGLVLGLAGSAPGKYRPMWPALMAAAGLAAAGAYIAWLLDWFRIGAGVILPRRPDPATLAGPFIIVFVATALILSSSPRAVAFFHGERPRCFLRYVVADLIVAGLLACGVIFYAARRPYLPSQAPSLVQAGMEPGLRRAAPNIALIVLDTVRADHLSCYGYSRRTTPAIDQVAAHGVLFENAYAPASWTLASIASIFTGLLPHQNGANWGAPLNAAPRTLAQILKSLGYATAGFNSNPFYGLGAWRLSEGFDLYIDDSYSIRHSVAATLVGQSILQFFYDHFVRYNQFNQRSAADVNRDIRRWFRSRPPERPFFLFVNYMDAHRPYLPPSPYDKRFGEIPQSLLAKLVAPLNNGRPSKPYTAIERREMIDGYDNSLLYLDSQVAKLLHFIDSRRSASAGRPTFVIITSDHGEGFGEHRTYDHGWNLYREVLRVPLIIEGPGIPAGLHIGSVAGSRQLFSTVLDLAAPGIGPVRGSSLSRFWEANPEATPLAPAVVSELAANNNEHHENALLSLVTPHWQYIEASPGRAWLYNLQADPLERDSLAGASHFQPVTARLQQLLEARIADSVLPWYAPGYLAPLNRPGEEFIERVSRAKAGFASEGAPIGAVQAYFIHQARAQLPRPSPAEQDLLRSLPYH
ncbi:MAG: sulfatase, partial [Terriglobia bacterium]